MGASFELRDSALTVTVTPPVAGTYEVTVTQSQFPSIWTARSTATDPVARATPCLTLPAACESVFGALGHDGCGPLLFDAAGVQVSSVDGGVWLGRGEDLFAWRDGLLSRVSFPGQAPVFSQGVAVPRPTYWSVGAQTLAVGSPSGLGDRRFCVALERCRDCPLLPMTHGT